MKFSELPYHRPDLETLRKELTAVLERFQTAPDSATAEAAYLEMDRVFGGYLTQQVIASIRRDIDTRDPFYEGEKAWYNQVGPELQPLLKAWVRATLDSPFRSQLEEVYGATSFLNNELSLKTFAQRSYRICSWRTSWSRPIPVSWPRRKSPLKAAHIPWPSWLPLKRMPMTPAAWRPGRRRAGGTGTIARSWTVCSTG